MNTYTIVLYDAVHNQTIEHVACFTGEDASGSFGILAGHERFITCLSFGMARVRTASNSTIYLAMPGGVLYFDDNLMSISTRHFVVSENFEHIHSILQREILDEEIQLQSLKQSFSTMENELMKRLIRTGHAL